MATGTGIQDKGGIETSRTTPTVDLDVGAAQAYQGLARLGQTINETIIDPALKDIAVRKGQQQGADLAAGKEGATTRVLGWGEIADARKAALSSAYMAGTKNDIDARLAKARQDHAFDPEGYDKTAKEVVSGFIQGAPPEFAVSVEQYAQGRASANLQVVAGERVQRDQQEVVNALTARETSLSADLEAMAANGQFGSDAYASTLLEYQGILKDKVDNPTIAYTPEQAQGALDKTLDVAQSALLGREAVRTYELTEGSEYDKRAAATRALQSEFDDTEGVFAGLPPARKLQLFNAAKKTIDTKYTVDREEGRAEEEAAREAKAAAREKSDSISLDIAVGAGSREAILSADIGDDQKALLLTRLGAYNRTQAAEARRDAAIVQLGQRQTYADFRDQAAAGTLSPAEVASGVSSGLIKPGQARTLQTLNDKTLKPVVEGALSPFKRDAGSTEGKMTVTPVMRQQAEAEAASWARMNPNASLEQQLEAGEHLAKKYFGKPAATATAPGARAALKQELTDVNARAASGKITPAEANRLRSGIADRARKLRGN